MQKKLAKGTETILLSWFEIMVFKAFTTFMYVYQKYDQVYVYVIYVYVYSI